MKKALVIVIVAAMVLGVMAIAGCGGDANKDEAQQYMEEGDAKMDTVQTKWAGIEEQQGELATAALEGDYSGFSEETAAQFTEEFESIKSVLDEAFDKYKAITGLEGVEDYKDYASKMMEAIELWKNKVDFSATLLQDLSEALVAAQQGADVDLVTMMLESEEYTAIQELDEEIEAFTEEAEQIKKEKGLSD